MPRVTCSFCGLPFNVRRVQEDASYYCCSGCALASRIPVGPEQFPVSRGLVISLALGFGLFNEILFGALAAAVAGEGRVEVGAKLALMSFAIGAMLLGACVGFVVTTRARRWTDAGAAALAVALGAWSTWAAMRGGPLGALWPLLGANVWFALWLARGFARRAWRRLRGPGAV